MISTSPRFLSSMSYSQLFSHQTLFTVLLLLLTLWFGEFLLIWALEVHLPRPPPPPTNGFLLKQYLLNERPLRESDSSRVTALPSDLPERGTLGTDGSQRETAAAPGQKCCSSLDDPCPFIAGCFVG